MTVWFTVKLDDRPGSLARVATALAERGVNITGIVGVAEDTDGALMLTTSDPAATREAFAGLGAAVRGARPDRRDRARRAVRQRPPARRGRPRLARLMPALQAPPTRRPSGSMSSTAPRRSRRSPRASPPLGGRIRALATVRQLEGDPPLAEIELEVEGIDEDALVAASPGASPTSGRSIRPGPSTRSSASGSSSSAAAPRSPRSPSGPSARPTATTCAASGSASTRSRSSARRTSPPPCGPSRTCRAPACSSSPARSWAATSAWRPTSCAPSASRSSPSTWSARSPTTWTSSSRDPGPGRHDGGHGRRRHGHLRPRPPARPAVLSGRPRCASRPGTSTRSRPARRRSSGGWNGRRRTSCSSRRPSSPTTTRRSCPSRCSATTCSTTARDAGTGSAIATRQGLPVEDVVTNFGDGPVRDSGPGAARRRRRGGLRPVRRGADGQRAWSTASGSSAIYAPNGRVVGSPFYTGKLRLVRAPVALARRDADADRAAA